MRIVFIIAAAGVLLTGVKWAFFPFVPWRSYPATASATCASGCGCGCTPAPGTPRRRAVAAVGPPRRVPPQRPGTPVPDRCGSASSARSARTRSWSAALTTGMRLRLPLDEHAVVTSPPRGGKTGWLASVILRYPGPVLSTTTKHDVFELTSGIRARRGPVHVFNPQGVGDVPSTFRWNPLDGCPDPATAIRRADAFAQSVSQQGRRRSHVLGQQGQRLPARLLPRRRTRRSRPARGRPLGHRDEQHRRRDHPRQLRRRHGLAVGQPARRTARRGQQDRADDQDDHEPRAGVPRRPRARRLRHCPPPASPWTSKPSCARPARCT